MTAKPDDGIGKADGNGGGTRATRWPPAVVDQDYPVDPKALDKVLDRTRREEANGLLLWLAAEGCFEGLSAVDMEAMKDSVANGKHRGAPGAER